MTLHPRAVAFVLPGHLCDSIREELARSARGLDSTADTDERENGPDVNVERRRMWRETADGLRKIRDAIPSVAVEEATEAA